MNEWLNAWTADANYIHKSALIKCEIDYSAHEHGEFSADAVIRYHVSLSLSSPNK